VLSRKGREKTMEFAIALILFAALIVAWLVLPSTPQVVESKAPIENERLQVATAKV